MTWNVWGSPRRAMVAAGIFLMPAALGAHDFWIEPSSFRAAPDTLIRIALRVGHAFEGDPVVRDSARVARFVVATPDGVQEVIGQDGRDPAGLLRPTKPGMYVIGYQGVPTPHVMESQGFDRYLEEEGLESIRRVRALRALLDTPGREMFSRAAKSLVLVGDGTDDGYNRRLGLPLEIVPEASPVGLTRTSMLPLRVLYLGAPLRDVLVTAFLEVNPHAPMTARSDASGRVAFPAKANGRWIVKTVHMVPASPGVDADWESVWASLTFEVTR